MIFPKLKEIIRTIKEIKPKLSRMREAEPGRTANIIVIRDTVSKNGIPTGFANKETQPLLHILTRGDPALRKASPFISC